MLKELLFWALSINVTFFRHNILYIKKLGSALHISMSWIMSKISHAYWNDWEKEIMNEWMCVCVCVCVCEREREREKERERAGYGLDARKIVIILLAGGEIFLSSKVFRRYFWSPYRQAPLQWVPRPFPRRQYNCLGVTLLTHFHLLQRLETSGAAS